MPTRYKRVSVSASDLQKSQNAAENVVVIINNEFHESCSASELARRNDNEKSLNLPEAQIQQFLKQRAALSFPSNTNPALEQADEIILKIRTSANDTFSVEMLQRFTIGGKTVGISRLHQNFAKQNKHASKTAVVEYTSHEPRAAVALPEGTKPAKAFPAVRSTRSRNPFKVLGAYAQTTKSRKRISLPAFIGGAVLAAGALVAVAATALFFPPALIAPFIATVSISAKLGIVAGAGLSGLVVGATVASPIPFFFSRRRLRNDFNRLASDVDGFYNEAASGQTETCQLKKTENKSESTPAENAASKWVSYKPPHSGSYGANRPSPASTASDVQAPSMESGKT